MQPHISSDDFHYPPAPYCRILNGQRKANKSIFEGVMMEAEKNSCMDLQLCLVHDDSTHENDPPEATKLDGSAHDSRQGTEESSSVESSQKMMADKERKDIRIRFPFKLYDILHDSKTQGREHIISWDPEGKSFKVHQPEDFVTEVMPKYFKQTKYRSFQRMLNLYSFKKVFVGRGRGGYIHPKFIRDRKELCNTIKLRIKASRRTSCRDYSALFRSPNAFRSLDDKNSATLPNVGCDDELLRPRNIPSEMSHSFTPIMRKSPPISPSLCRQKKIASIEMKEASSSSLDLLQHFTGQQQVEQQIGSSLLVASIADHSANSSACDVDTWYHPMAPTRFRAALNEHDFNNQTNTISFADYDRMFHKPLSDDLEPKHFPPSNVMIAERHTIGLGVVDHRLTPPIILGHDICFDVKVGFDIPSMSPDTSMAKMYPPIHLDSNSYPRHH